MNLSTADERRPLLATSSPPNATGVSLAGNGERAPSLHATGLVGNVQEIAQEIQQVMKEQAPGTNFLDLLKQRPISVVFAICSLLALMFVSSSFVSLQNPQIFNNLIKIPQIVPLDLQLSKIGAHEINVVTKVSVTMDYGQLGGGIMSGLVKSAADKIGQVNLGVDGPIILSALVDEDDDNGSVWKHVIQAETTQVFDIALSSNGSQSLSIHTTLSDVGQTSAIEYIVQRLLMNHTVKFQARGVLNVGKFGLSTRLPFDFETGFSLPTQTSEEMAELARIDVGTTNTRALNATALMNVTVGDLPFRGQFPQLHWQVKIPGCNPLDRVVLCQGQSHPFALLGSDSILNMFFSAIVEQLPPALVNPCDPTQPNSVSALDRWIAGFIGGEVSTFYVEGVRHSLQPPILSELLAGYDIPYSVYGKSPTEKLIESLELDEVRFGSASLASPEVARFSGKATVDIVLPGFLTMSPSARAAVAVESVMGNIQLFDTMRRHVGQIMATEQWIPTISLAHDGGFTVVCKFDNVPTEVTDRQAFAEISRALLVGGHATVLYDAIVNLKIMTSAGSLVLKKVRIRGETEMRK